MTTFFTSDTHFGHGGALGLYRRPFSSVAAMNAALVDGWNETVGPDDDGNLTSRKIPGAVLHDPELVRERVVNMVLNEEIVSRNGKRLKLRLDTLCVHGDEPSGVIVARAARQGLEAAGVRVVPLPELTLG